MSDKRVVKKTPKEGPTSPGDVFSIGISGEVTNRQGQKFWPRFGIESAQRPTETSEEAVDRVSDFVMETFDAFVSALK